MNAYRAGNVTLANAIGTGRRRRQGVYPFVPEMIRFYLGEEPILPNVPTYVGGARPTAQYILERIDELVVKAVDQSGGYGMLIGPAATPAERDEFRTLRSRPSRGTTSRSRRSPSSRHPTFVRRRPRRAATSTCGRSSSPAPRRRGSFPAG